jgi:hypothetical protein
MSCAPRGIDSATAAVDLEAAGEGVPGSLVSSNRLHQNEADRKRMFNRTENVRPIPPSDADFPRLYGRRNDSESLNRSLVGLEGAA